MKKDAQYLLTEKKFIDVLGETPENIYIPNPQIRLEYQDLYDAYITDEIAFSEIEEKDFGFFISEYPYFSKHLNIVSNKNNKIFFNAQFLSTFEAGCKGSISVLGRYFSSSHRYVSWNEKPRNSLAAEIYNSKKIEDFLLWNNELVDALETFLRFFVN